MFARLMGWGRFWLSLLITILVNTGLIVGYAKINPNVSVCALDASDAIQ